MLMASMDDNLSTKSSESSITTSGEYEIVTDSNVTTPLELQAAANTIIVASSDIKNTNIVTGYFDVKGNKSPTLALGNNRNISDLKHEMTDALREIVSSEKEDDNFSVVSDVSGIGDDVGGSAAALSGKQKLFSLNLTGISSPTLVVPETDNSNKNINSNNINGELNEQQQQQLQQNDATIMKPKSIGTPRSDCGDISTYSEHNRVGHSVFYDCIDASPAAGVTPVTGIINENKQDKNDTDEEISDIDQGCTIFSGVTYLGAANINAPKSEIDIYRIMSELNSGSSATGLKISISIPNCSEGLVVLHDAESNSLIATYEIQSIILYFRGPADTVEHGCFAFTWLHGENLFQCHVFRCHIPEAVNQVSACFQKAFQTYPTSMTCSLTSAIDSNMINSVTSDLSGNPLSTAGYEFIVSLEIREKVAKNSYSAVPRDRNCFKLRANTDKEVYITVKQTSSTIYPPLLIERCFGVLLSPGKLVRQADMQLIDLVSMGYQQQQQQQTQQQQQNQQLQQQISQNSTDNNGTVTSTTNNTNTSSSHATTLTIPLCLNPYCIRAEWKANEKAFLQLNTESTKTFLTVAVDIVMRGIQEPVRFVIETPVSIQSAGEIRLIDHFISKRPMTMRFYLHLKRTTDEFSWEVSSIDPSEEIIEQTPQATSSSSSYLLKFGMNNLSRIVRSSSIVSIEDECPTDYSSDGDEPLLSGTGEVSKDCSQDTLDEWDPVLKEWGDGEKRPKNLAHLVRLGVPEALREKVWQKLANIESKMEMNDMYKTLITKETKCETVIQRDIHRTFPAHKCFKETGGSGQDALFKVSKAYAVYDSEVGYCQGLSFIAASLLLHMPEEDAFCVLVALMYDYGLRDMYKQGFEVLYLRLYQLDRLIKDHLPKLHEHFAISGIETHMYASQWFLTLFTARFPLCFVFHVLDVFLLDGIPLLFQVAITLLSICETDLRQLDFEGILKYFRVTLPKKCRSSSQARKIMKSACERKIKKLKHYEEEYMLKKQHKEREEKEQQLYEIRFSDERRKFQAEIDALQLKLSEANERAFNMERKHTNIIQDYKQIIQRLEQDMSIMNETLGNMMTIMAKCKNCTKQIENDKSNDEATAAATAPHAYDKNLGNFSINNMKTNENNMLQMIMNQKNKTIDAPLGPLDPLNAATQRIRELELELAQAKLAHVEAECRNQDLNHQLNTTISEMQTNRNSWQPWLSKTFNTLQEKVTTRSGNNGSRDGQQTQQATFQSYTTQNQTTAQQQTDTLNSPTGNQDLKALFASGVGIMSNVGGGSIGGTPKLPPKFQSARLRNSIDSLRNVGSIRNTLENVGVVGVSVDNFKQQFQS